MKNPSLNELIPDVQVPVQKCKKYEKVETESPLWTRSKWE